MTLTIQIECDNSIGKDGRKFTREEMLTANASLNECCSKLEGMGYVSAGLFVDGEAVSYPEIQDEWDEDR